MEMHRDFKPWKITIYSAKKIIQHLDLSGKHAAHNLGDTNLGSTNQSALHTKYNQTKAWSVYVLGLIWRDYVLLS